MIQPIKKVIRASAGTGKTYRLSLEYIGLLLQFRRYGLHFSEILVITFTKKATAEIRERIFAQLNHIVLGDQTGLELRRNLEIFFNLHITEQDIADLRAIYLDMLTNKHQVQISTIDSFTNTIFKTIIAPYLGITDYVVQPQIDPEIKDELYRSILEDEKKLAIFRSFFERSELKTVSDYEKFVESVIRHRWAFYLITSAPIERPFVALSENKNLLQEQCREAFSEFARTLQVYVETEHPTKSASDVLNTDYFNLLADIVPAPQVRDIHRGFAKIPGDDELVDKHYALLLEERNIWNGGKLFRKKEDGEKKERMAILQAQARTSLADYLFATRLLAEEKDLFNIIDDLLTRYDELKFRDKIFTHDDISFYTFKYLYDPELSLIDGDYVSNSFYEYLSTYTRFVLIDEFQDTSIIQHKILLPMVREVISGAGVKDYGGAIVVGDEKQSIYGWRGGERDLLLKMPAIMHTAEQITLDTSYRSDENIIAFINTLFDHAALHQQLGERGIEWPYTPILAAKKNDAGYVELFLRNTAPPGKNSQNTIATPEEAVREFLANTLDSPMHKKRLGGKTAILARRNADLDIFAAALDEMGITYMQESSNSILEHRAVKPVFLCLQFLLYGDFYDLLVFLRSDVVLFDTSDLKELLLAYRGAPDKWDVRAILDHCRKIPPVDKFLALWEILRDETDLFLIAQKIFEAYNITGRFTLESDVKNINQFLLLLADFLNTGRDYPKSLKGFLDYCDDKHDTDAFKQVGLEETNAISLMTIHKAKGLEFDNVFLYWNLAAGNGRTFRELRPYLHYEDSYTAVADYLLTFNYDRILAQSSLNYFTTEVERREAIEELNNFYVALTRAKSNLFLCFTYKKTGGFDTLLEETDEKNMALLLVEHIRGVFAGHYTFYAYTVDRARGEFGDVVATGGEKNQPPDVVVSHLAPYFDTNRQYAKVDKERLQREEFVDFKRVFLDHNAVEIGNLVHYYLSFIKRGTEEEKQHARRRVISFYGTLIPTVEIVAIVARVNDFIAAHPDVFSTAWSHIYTEFTIFTHDGHELRIDRLMVNEAEKSVEIIDYKTGHSFEPEQIEIYIAEVSALPLVRQNGYAVGGRFLEIDVRRGE